MWTLFERSGVFCSLISTYNLFPGLVFGTSFIVLLINPYLIVTLQCLSYLIIDGSNYLRLLYPEAFGVLVLPFFPTATVKSSPTTTWPIFTFPQVAIFPELPISIAFRIDKGLPLTFYEKVCAIWLIYFNFLHWSWLNLLHSAYPQPDHFPMRQKYSGESKLSPYGWTWTRINLKVQGLQRYGTRSQLIASHFKLFI